MFLFCHDELGECGTENGVMDAAAMVDGHGNAEGAGEDWDGGEVFSVGEGIGRVG